MRFLMWFTLGCTLVAATPGLADDWIDCKGKPKWSKNKLYHKGDVVTDNDSEFSSATPVRSLYLCNADACDDAWAGPHGGYINPGSNSSEQWSKLGMCQ